MKTGIVKSNFTSWAIANPTLLPEYKNLVNEAQQIDKDIKKQEQILQDVRRGITPDTEVAWGRYTTTIPLGIPEAILNSAILLEAETVKMLVPEVDVDEYTETMLIQLQKESHYRNLERAESDAQRQLNGWTYSPMELGFEGQDIHYPGLYAKHAMLLGKLEDFDPGKEVIDWHRDLPGAIEQRLITLGWNQGFDARNLESLIDDFADWMLSENIPRFHFSLFSHDAGIWVARITGATCITRCSPLPLRAVQRVVITYLEVNWLALIDKVCAPQY